LWGRIPSGDHHEPQQSPPNYQPHDGGAQFQQGEYKHDEKPMDEPHKEHHWYEDKGKLGLAAIGGGVAAAVLGGGIHHLVKKHEEKEDEEEGRIEWINEARARTEQFYRDGPRGPATWLLAQGKDFPPRAIEVGRDNSSPLYISRVYYDGGKQIGAASGDLEKGAVIGYQHKEHHRDIYEILVGDMHGLHWEPARGKLHVNELGFRPVEGGHENDGSPLYIIRAHYKKGYFPGKASATLDGAYIPVDGTEKNVKEYEVLCYNS
ncbi:Streptogrisin-C, partial [Termitomyces sp. T112]